MAEDQAGPGVVPWKQAGKHLVPIVAVVIVRCLWVLLGEEIFELGFGLFGQHYAQHCAAKKQAATAFLVVATEDGEAARIVVVVEGVTDRPSSQTVCGAGLQ